MKLRTFTALLLAAIMLFALTACGSQAADDSSSDQQQEQQDTTTNESNEFRVGMECAYAPNNWQESEATDSNVPVENVAGAYAEGYDVQIAKAIAEDLGKELVIVKLSWDGLIDALNHGQIEGVDHLSPVGSVPDMISRLQQGSCDAIVVNVENAPGYLASNPDFRLITFSEGSGFTLPAKGSCVGLRKSDTALLEQINEILGTLDNATRDEMWQTAVDNQPQ